MPSKLPGIYWTNSFDDLRAKLRLRSSFEQVKFFQEFQIMSELLSMAFGGGKEKQSDDVNVLTPRNRAEAKRMLAQVLGRRA